MKSPAKKNYCATFIGCERGAIGIHYRIHATVTGANPEDARLNLFERYDHIQHLRLTEDERQCQQ